MDMESKYDHYVHEKQIYNIVYRGIKLNCSDNYYLWHLFNNMEIGDDFKRCFLFCSAYELRKAIKFDPSKHTILSTFRGDRRDNKEMYNNVVNQLGCSISINYLSDTKTPRIFKLNIKTCFWLFCQIVQKGKRSSLNVRQKFYLFQHFMQICNTIDIIYSMKLDGVKKYLCMFNALFLESILTQYFKNIGVPTYSLDEGVHFIYKTNTPVDSIQYENMQTDTLLCWGQYTKDEYESFGISSDRVVVGGYPLIVKKAPFIKKDRITNVVLLLARSIFDASNINMLRELSTFSNKYKFYIKLHPSLLLEKYKVLAHDFGMIIVDKNTTIQECLNNNDFDISVAINTTAYYESFLQGLPCMRYSDGQFDLMPGYEYDVFTTGTDFEKCIDHYMSIDNEKYESRINHVLKYAIGYGVNNYKNILMNE